MKYSKLIFFFAILLLFGGCEFLNYNEGQVHDLNSIFKSSSPRSKQFLSTIYNMIPHGFNSVGAAMRASATADAEENNDFAKIQKMNDGRWSAVNTVDSKWGALYKGIRATNIFLENFDIHSLDSLKYNKNYERLLKQYRLYKYQAQFLRALFYFRLIKRYGGVPLVKKVLTPDSVNYVKPSSYQEVTQFIVSECNEIIPFLQKTYQTIPAKETGRATRGAAMALKAKVLLYAASPLHNPSHDVQKWIKAAKAAKAIINTGWYSLEPDYSNAFNNLESSGLIFGRRSANSNFFEKDNLPAGYFGSTKNGTNPTQNLVNAYHMQTTGLPITNPNSGYDPQHPYKNRDPRLEKSIIVNNSLWKGRNVQIWHDGLDGPPKEKATETGYYLKKFVVEGVVFSATRTTNARHVWPIFRYGGILLDYAEAMNEAYGPYNSAGMGMSAWDAVHKIRHRVDMPDFPMGLTKAEFRKKLRNERRVEMAFENQRFWDIRRWKMGHSTDIKGMKITKNSDGSFTYNVKTIEHRDWNNRMYYYPIPQSEIFKNDNLKQNDNW